MKKVTYIAIIFLLAVKSLTMPFTVYASGNALSCDGTNDVAHTGDNLIPDATYSIEFKLYYGFATSSVSEKGIFATGVSSGDPTSGGVASLIQRNAEVWRQFYGGYVSDSGNTAMTQNTWYDVYFAHDNTNDKAYFGINGTVHEITDTMNHSTGTSGTAICAGYAGYFSGAIDSMRISNTIRHTTSFTPNEAPLEADGSTIALYQFDEASGTAVDDASTHDLTMYGGAGRTTGYGWTEVTPTPTPSPSPTPTPTATPTPTPAPPNPFTTYPTGLTGACSIQLTDKTVSGGVGSYVYKVTNLDEFAELSKIRVYWESDPDPDDHQTYQCFSDWSLTSDYPERGHFYCSAGDSDEYKVYTDAVSFAVNGEPIQQSIKYMKVACYFDGSGTPATDAVLFEGESLTQVSSATPSASMLENLRPPCDDIVLNIPIAGEFRIPNYVCEVKNFFVYVFGIDTEVIDNNILILRAILDTKIPFAIINTVNDTLGSSTYASPSGVANLPAINMKLYIPLHTNGQVNRIRIIDDDLRLSSLSAYQTEITQVRDISKYAIHIGGIMTIIWLAFAML